MKSTSLQVAIAAFFCASQPMVVSAQSSAETFASGRSSVIATDGAAKLTGLGYQVVGGHAVAEGDIVLGRIDQSGQVSSGFLRGLGQSRLLDRWTNGIIPYQYSKNVSTKERELADQAIAHWNQYTSIRMVELNDDNRGDFSNFLTFEASNGCASYVGMRGGEQPLWISARCSVGSIIHEIGHAVGLFHEHTRNDRDSFIQINQGNIVDGKAINFDILTANTELLGEYNYDSIMHYGENFFSSNGNPTITALNDAQIGQRIALSAGDIASVDEMYKTDLSLHVDVRDELDNNQIVVEVQVTNQGARGANQLSLNVDIGEDVSWLSMSPGSAWECVTNDTTLECKRSSLGASATSLFTVVAAANGATASDVSAELLANTRETGYHNNGYKRTVVAPARLSAFAATSDSQTPIIGGKEPIVGPANPADSMTDSDVSSSVLAVSQQNQSAANNVEDNVDTSDGANANSVNPFTTASDDSTGAEFDRVMASSGGGAVSPLTGFGLYLTMVGLRLGRRAAMAMPSPH